MSIPSHLVTTIICFMHPQEIGGGEFPQYDDRRANEGSHDDAAVLQLEVFLMH